MNTMKTSLCLLGMTTAVELNTSTGAKEQDCPANGFMRGPDGHDVECRTTNGECEWLDMVTWEFVKCGTGADNHGCVGGWLEDADGYDHECRVGSEAANGECEMLDLATFDWVSCSTEESDNHGCVGGWLLDADGYSHECRV